MTVEAPEGVFPEGATLSVEQVPVVQAAQAEEAVEGLRDENSTVAVSYTFDIRVLDADGRELQPADEQSVKVSFRLAEAADANLEAQVYHVSGDEADKAIAALEALGEKPVRLGEIVPGDEGVILW